LKNKRELDVEFSGPPFFFGLAHLKEVEVGHELVFEDGADADKGNFCPLYRIDMIDPE
jgi:hypothetical protein